MIIIKLLVIGAGLMVAYFAYWVFVQIKNQNDSQKLPTLPVSKSLQRNQKFSAILNQQKIDGIIVPCDKGVGYVYLLFNALNKEDWGYRNKEFLPQEGVEYGNFTHHWKYPSSYISDFITID